MAVSTTLDLHQGRPLQPADLLEHYRHRQPTHPLAQQAVQRAALLSAPGPELPWTFTERREAIYAALHRGQKDDAETLAVGWVEAVLAEAEPDAHTALELIAALEALTTLFEAQGAYSDAATTLAAALRLHSRRQHQPFHGTLLRHAVSVLGSLGAIDAARLVAAEALRLGIETGDNKGIAYSLAAAHRTASMARDWPACLASIAAARRYLPETEDFLRFSLDLGELSACTELGRFAEAEAAHTAAEASLEGRDTPLTASYRTWALGRFRQAQGRHQEAEVELAKALDLARNTQEPVNRMLILLDLAESLEKLGDPAKLHEAYHQLAGELPPLENLEGGQPVVERWTNLAEKLAVI